MAASKKLTRKEVKAPDEFLTSMGKVINFLQLYGGWILLGAALIILAIVGGIALSRHHEASLVERSKAFEAAVAPILKTATEEGSSDLSSVKSALPNIEKFLAEHQDSNLAFLAKAMMAVGSLATGDTEKALSLFGEVLGASKGFSLSPIMAEAAGGAAEKAGRKEEAERYFLEMAQSDSRFFRAVAYQHLGDLYNPVGSREGDGKKAKEFYEKGLSELPKDEALLAPYEAFERKVLQNRLASVR